MINSKISHLQILIVAALGLTLLTLLLPMGYETNDDIGMELTYSGYYTGSPESGSIYNHIALSKVLSYLYQLISGVNWYVLLHVGTLFVSMMLLVWHIIRHAFSQHHILIGIILIFGGYTHFIVQLNFATVAFLSGFTGVLYILDNPWRLRSKTLYIALGLISMSLMIRQHFFILALLMHGLNIIIQIKNCRKHIHIKLLSLAIFYVAMLVSNYLYYRDNGAWGESHVKYQALVYLVDNPSFNAYYLRPHLKTLGWTENDLYLFKNFYFELPGNLTLKKLHFLNRAIPRDMMDYDEFFPAIFKYTPAYMLIFILMSWCFSAWYYGRTHLIYNLLFFGLIICFLFYLTGNKVIFKNRMMDAIFLGVITSNYLPLGFQAIRSVRIKPLIGIAVILLSVSLIPKIMRVQNMRKELRIMNSYLGEQYAQNQVFEFYFYYPVGGFNSLLPSASQMPSNKFIPSGWLMNTPIGISNLKRLGYSSISQAITNDRTIHLIPSGYNENYRELMSQYFLQYYNMRIKFKEMERFKTNLQWWTVLKLEPELN